MFRKHILMLGLAAITAPAMAALQWQTDLPAALEQAAKENKAVLVDFTGSDWCGWCIKLRKEILDTPEFEAYAADKFIPVEIDMPRKKQLSPEQLKHNKEVGRKYKIEGFPTLLVLNSEGIALGGFVGGRPDFASVKDPLEEGLSNLKRWEDTRNLQGMDKAKALYELCEHIPTDINVDDFCEEIISLDPEDTLGLKKMKAVSQEADEITQTISSLKTPEEQLAKVNEYLPVVAPENQQMLRFLKANLMLLTAKTEEDIVATKAAVIEFINSIPDLSEEERAERMQGVEKDFGDTAKALQNAIKMQESQKKH